MGVGVAVLREKVCRGLVFTACDELRLDARLVQRVAQEQGVGRETHQADSPRRLHPHLAERRRQVVGQGAGIRFGPRQRRFDIAERRDGFAQFLHRPGRRGRDLHPGDQAGHPGVVGGAVDGSDDLAQQQGPATVGDHRERVEPGGLVRHGLQVEFEHAAVGHTAMPGGVDLAGQ